MSGNIPAGSTLKIFLKSLWWQPRHISTSASLKVAMTNNCKLNKMEPILISADDSAQLLGIGRTLFYSMHSSGRLGPLPIKLGRRSLWNRKEIENWVELGCPARKQWLNGKNENYC